MSIMLLLVILYKHDSENFHMCCYLDMKQYIEI